MTVQRRGHDISCPYARKTPLRRSAFPGLLNLLAFPVAPFEENDADGGHRGFGDDDGPIDAVRLHARVKGQEVRERNFEHPEREEVDDGRRNRVAGAVEGLQHNHGVGVADVAVAENAQRGDGERDDGWIVGEETDDRFGESDEEDADDAEKNHVVEAGAPDGFFRALGLLGAEILADERGGGVAQAPRWQNDKDKYADGDGVASKCGRTEDADDADQADPTGVRDGELQNAGE